MSAEHGDRKPPFVVQLKPLVKDANPYEESKYKPPFIGSLREINERAALQESVLLYEGDIVATRFGDKPIQVKGFIDIRTAFFTDNEPVYGAEVCWGLKDAATKEDIDGYIDSAIDPDPIHIFRIVKILEALPRLREDFDESFDDLNDAMGAAGRAFFLFQLSNGEDKEYRVETRRKIAEVIGKNKLRDILQMLPPNLEEMIEVMREKGIYVATENLEREIRLKRFIPSEYHHDAVAKWHQDVEDFAEGFRLAAMQNADED